MPVHDELGTRMKENYENRAKTYLLRRTPVAIRIDGKAFHTFTRGFEKPFDRILMQSMQETMKYLCENIQGCVLGYTQSDEITLILQDYKELTTDAWFDYQVEKICSIAASMATLAFNRCFTKNVNDWITAQNNLSLKEKSAETDEQRKFICSLMHTYDKAIEKGALFDARCFNIPKEEIANLIYWRQQDASKNSVQMVARAYFSDKQLHKKNTSEMQEMLFSEKGINWNNFPTDCKRGSCCIKKLFPIIKNSDCGSIATGDYNPEDVVWRSHWVVDTEIPIFVNENRNYINKQINFE